MGPQRIGIDLGGTKIEAVLLDVDGSEVLRHRIPTPKGDYDATLAAIGDLVTLLENKIILTGLRVGVGIPGSVSAQTNLVRNANSTWLNGRDFTLDLEKTLNREVRVSNDANCLALSEYRDGAAKDTGSLFAVIIGTGVGGGLVIKDQLVEGANGLGGEWGHMALAGEESPRRDCFCGKKGCLETYLSGPAVVEEFGATGGRHVGGVDEIVKLAKGGDLLAQTTLDRHLDRLGRALGVIVNIIDPEMIVLGGGLSLLPGIAKNLPNAIRPHVFAPKKDQVVINVKLAHWGDSSGVRGAAQLWEAGE